ncbi:23510_t:CDS:1, partial [Racocetra persica]
AQIGNSSNANTAFEWMLKSAKNGYDVAQDVIGRYYEEGFGVTQNFEQAFKWYLLAAENDNSNGLVNVARCCAEGI